MLTNPQKQLLKRAQRAAGIGDAEYRASLSKVTGLPHCSSSTDKRLADPHLDTLMAYFEAIYWRAVDAGYVTIEYGRSRVFLMRGYWADKNQRGNTSRDRFTRSDLAEKIEEMEAKLKGWGASEIYLQGIEEKTGVGHPYLAALTRTVQAWSHNLEQRLENQRRRAQVWGADHVYRGT